MKKKTRYFFYILVFIGWVILQYVNKAHYGEESWVTDQWLVWGVGIILLMLISAFELERLKRKAIKLIWPGGSCTIDTGNPFCRLPPVLDEVTGKIIIPEYWVYAINGWIAPKLYHWPGGEEEGYIMVPKSLVINFGNHIALNVADMEFFMGENRHRDLPREQYHLLYRHCIDKGHGWDEDRKVGWGFIPYYGELTIDVASLGDSKRWQKLYNRKESYMEEEIEGYREKYSSALLLQAQQQGAVTKKPAKPWKEEQQSQKINKDKEGEE